MSPTAAPVSVTVKYLVSVRERAGRAMETAGFAPGSTRADLARHLETRSITSSDSSITAIVNGIGWDRFAESPGIPLADGDVACLFPRISGG